MITAVVTFKLPDSDTRDSAVETFQAAAPNYLDMPGLVRKYFLVNDENEAGGVYLWESKEAAEKIYAGEWRDKLKARFGAEPKIAYFETPVIADLLKGEVSTD